MLGTSGTVTTLAGVHLNLPRYDRRRVDGVWMNDADVSATVAKLLGMTPTERRHAAEKFTQGNAVVLLATDAASEGLNLHQRCRLVINLDLPWRLLRKAAAYLNPE